MVKRRRALQLGVLASLFLWAVVVEAQTERRRGPFTHEPRSVRSRDFDQRHVRLELRLTDRSEVVEGRAVHRVVPFKTLRRLQFDACDMKILGVARLTSDGSVPLRFEHRGGVLTVQLDRPCPAGQELTLSIDYRVANPRSGFHFVVRGTGSERRVVQVWTQSEPEYARYWFPCFDHPSDRLTSETVVTAPSTWVVVSNGRLVSSRLNADGTKTWHWALDQTHVTYLMSVVAGRFEQYRQQWEGIPVVAYVPPDRMADAPRSFAKTPQMIGFFSERTGYRFPWPKYAQVCVEEYMWGGMEHTSATTLNANTLHDEQAHLDVSSDGLVAHELAHQWFGDLLTCKDWGELWLNESFATYFASLWTEHDRGWEEATWVRREHAQSYFNEDAKRYRRPIVTYRYDTPGRMFDRHCYPKGARVLHMLRFVLGDDLFWKAIRHYVRQYAFHSVETAQFRIAIEEATGQGLNWFFDEWLYHGGHPELDVTWDWDDETKTVSVTVRQTQTVDSLTPLFRMPVEIELATLEAVQLERVEFRRREHTYHFKLPQKPVRVCFDPNDWLLAKVVEHKSKEEWLNQLAEDRHVTCRARAVKALAEFKSDRDVATALAKAARHDAFWGVRQEAATVLGRFRGQAVLETLVEAARQDPKSSVRRAAIRSLKRFPQKAVRSVLLQVVRSDPSYFVVADALRTLAAVDPAGCVPVLKEAMSRPSHQGVVLRAACDGLAEVGETSVVPELRRKLSSDKTPWFERVAVLRALAKLAGDDPEVVSALVHELDNPYREVRSAACQALAETGSADALAALRARLNRETSIRVVEDLEEAIEKLEASQTDLARLRRRVDRLERENKLLQQRLKKLTPPSKP